MTQVLAIVDLPADLPAGEWPLRFHRVDAGGQPLSPELPFEHSITILESTGGVEDFNPLRAFFTDLGGSQESLDMEAGGEITSLYPWPKLTILFSGQTPPPAAAHVEMTYPVSRIQSILTVYNDVDPAHDSIVQWQDDGSGTLTLDVVNPRQLRLVLAVVFQPEAGEVLDPATDFALLASSTYDIDGNPGSATVQLDSIQ